MTRQGMAFFDFDGTIIKGDSIVPFLLYGYKKGFVPLGAFFKAVLAAIGYAFGRLSDVEAKQRSLAFLMGKNKKEIDVLAENFFNDILKKRCYHQALETIEQCKREGLKVLIVSASPDVYMQAVKTGLGADAIIATRCALDENNVYLGGLASNNCKGFEKTLRIAEFVASAGLDVDFEKSKGFGDSFSDVPMLELTAHPVIINGKKKTILRTPHMQHTQWK